MNQIEQEIQLEDTHKNESGDDDSAHKHDVLVFGEAELNAIQIPNHSLSGIVVSSVRQIMSEHDESVKYDIWTRYNTTFNGN